MLRIDAGASRIQSKLADGNAHAAGAQITKTEDALTVGNDDDVDLLVGNIGNDVAHVTAILGANVKTAMSAIDMAELLASLAHGRRINKRHVLFNVFHHELEVERLVNHASGIKRDVLHERRRLLGNQCLPALNLLIASRHGSGKKSAQSKRITLLLAESETTI